MSTVSTEAAIRDWRYGSTQAERLCAALLHIEGFKDVDPQHPLGGPDGLKDVRCKRQEKLWIAAVYFPPTPQSFREIQAKFIHDMAGVTLNSADGFAFFVNQPLSISDRAQLQSTAATVLTEIYSLERMRSILDSPKGCGARLQYLRIPMNEAEQWAFWNAMNYDVVRRLADNERRHDAQMGQLQAGIDLLLLRTAAIDHDLRKQASSLERATLPTAGLEMPTACFTSATLCWLHRVLTEDMGLPESSRGRFRSVQV